MILRSVAQSLGLFILLLNFTYAEEKENNNEIFFEKIEMNRGGNILAVDLDITKTGPTNFNVNGSVENFRQFDDDWTMSLFILQSDSANGKYQVIMTYPLSGKKKLCAFLKNEYKNYFYESLKDYSNAPHYDTCPLVPTKYVITDYPFDASMFKKYLPPGYIVVNMFFSHLDEIDLIQYDIYFRVEGGK